MLNGQGVGAGRQDSFVWVSHHDCAWWGGAAVRGGVAPPAQKRTMGGTPNAHWGQDTREAHLKHVAHAPDILAGVVDPARDAGRVEAQWLVERLRVKKHGGHARDAGRVEAQWLVERRCSLPNHTRRLLRHDIRAGTRGSVGGGKQRVQREPNWTVGRQGMRGAHVEHLVHVRDAGGIEAQRLVERKRTLPSQKGGDMWREKAARRRNDWTRWRQGKHGAHIKHGVHARDAGRVEAQRLIERACPLPSHKDAHGGRHAGRAAGREVGDGGRPRRTQRAGEGDTADWEHRACAHREHFEHACDAGRIETQWLVERTCFLPSHTGGDMRRHGAVCRCNNVQERTQVDNWQHLKHVAHARDAGRVKA
eukprot:scaffold71964_cov85-Phaeocystis_antarctica.AAC.1